MPFIFALVLAWVGSVSGSLGAPGPEPGELPRLRAGDISVVEGNEPGRVVELSLQLSAPSVVPVTVEWETVSDSAVAGLDFEEGRGLAVFEPGITAVTVPVVVHGDRLTESNERLFLRLGNASNATLERALGTVRILEDDGPPGLSVAGGSVTEGAGDPPTAVFVVRLSNPSTAAVTFGFRTRDHTALAGQDYLGRQGTLMFVPGETELSLEVPVLDDGFGEPEESFSLVVESPQNAVLEVPEASMTILDEDLTPVLTVGPAEVVEGGPGELSHLEFELRLSSPPRGSVSVFAETVPITATPHVDYVPVEGKVTFIVLDGERVTHRLRVPILGDSEAEPNETLSLRLSRATNAILSVSTAIGTIVNDDGPTLSIQDTLVLEPRLGHAEARFDVVLSGSTTQRVSVSYFTANLTAASDADYKSSRGWLTFLPGQTRQTVSVAVHADSVKEGPETFEVRLSSAVNASLFRSAAQATIFDDSTESLSVRPISVAEGSSRPGFIRFQVQLSNPLTATARVRYRIEGGTAEAGSDFVAASGVLTFPPGATVAFASALVIADDLPEDAETVQLILSDPEHARVPEGVFEASILDDDPWPMLEIGDVRVDECSGAGSASAVFDLRLSHPSGQAIEVAFASVGAEATPGLDFIPTNGVLRFDPGIVALGVVVPLVCDGRDEPEETFSLQLAEPVNVRLARSGAVATLVDADPPEVWVDDLSWTEPSHGVQGVLIPVNLTSPAEQPMLVLFRTAAGTATPGLDYLEREGQLEFPPGTLQQVIEIPILADALTEGPETFRVILSSPAGASILRGEAEVTLLDYDLPELSVLDALGSEALAGGPGLPVRVRLSRPSPVAVTFDYTTVPGTASTGLDFLPTQGSATLPPGTLELEIWIPVVGDGTPEPEESLGFRISGAIHARVVRAEARIILVDDDAPPLPELSLADVSVLEGDAGFTTVRLDLVLSRPGLFPAFVDVATRAETATAGRDYLERTVGVTFAPGETRRTLSLTVVGDVEAEPDETFLVVFGNPVGLILGRPAARVTIQDDEPRANRPPSVAFFAPNPGAVYELGETIPVEVTATDPDGDPLTLVLFLDGVEWQRSLQATHRFEWSDAVLGSHVLTATVTDSEGLAADAEPRSVEVRPHPRLSVADVTAPESDDHMAFEVRLSAASRVPLQLVVSTIDGTATGGVDYVPVAEVVAIAPGEVSRVIAVRLLEDALHEPGENFRLRIRAAFASGAEGEHLEATGTIEDNDEPVVNRAPTIQWVTPDGGASFELGETIPVEVTATDPDSDSLTVVFHVDGVEWRRSTRPPHRFEWDGAWVGSHVLTATAEDPEGLAADAGPRSVEVLPHPRLSLADVTVRESDGLAAFEVRLSGASRMPLQLEITTADGTATGGVDYLPVGEVVAVAPGEVARTLVVRVLDDSLHEPRESFWLRVRATFASGGESLALEATGFIEDEDPEQPNEPPQVVLVGPASRTVFDEGESVELLAVATDAEGALARVEFLSGDAVIGVAMREPYGFTWQGVPPGDHWIRARAVDAQGRSAETQPAVIAVTRVYGRAAILGDAGHPEVQTLVEFLFELGIPARVFPRAEADLVTLEAFDLVIWNDAGSEWVSDREVRLFGELAASGTALYWIGDRLVESLGSLSPTSAEAWIQLLRLRPSFTGVATRQIHFNGGGGDSPGGHPILGGIAGVVSDVGYPVEPGGGAQAGLDDGVALGQAGDLTVLVAVDAMAQGRRSVTQAFRVGGTGDAASLASRKRLFQNSVWWLLRYPACAEFNLIPTVSFEPASPAVGEEVRYALRAQLAGGCDALATRVTCELPAGLSFVDAALAQGAWSVSNRVVTFELGRLARATEVNLQLVARAEQSGRHQARIVWDTLNEGSAARGDNLLDAIVDISGRSRLTVVQESAGFVVVSIEGSPGQVCWIEVAPSPAGPWTTWTSVTLGTGPIRISLPVDGVAGGRFLRARQ